MGLDVGLRLSHHTTRFRLPLPLAAGSCQLYSASNSCKPPTFREAASALAIKAGPTQAAPSQAATT